MLAMQEALKPMLAMQEALKPLVEFHQAQDAATSDDLRLYWDVRLVRGPSEVFLSASGQSTLNGALSGSARNTLATQLQDEIMDKIARPLVSRAQDMVGKAALQMLPDSVKAVGHISQQDAEALDRTTMGTAPIDDVPDINETPTHE